MMLMLIQLRGSFDPVGDSVGGQAEARKRGVVQCVQILQRRRRSVLLGLSM